MNIADIEKTQYEVWYSRNSDDLYVAVGEFDTLTEAKGRAYQVSDGDISATRIYEMTRRCVWPACEAKAEHLRTLIRGVVGEE